MNDDPSPNPGLIFNLDDTLAWTAPFWREAERRLLDTIGRRWSESLARTYKGMNARDVAAVIHRAFEPDVPLGALQERMRQLLAEAVERGDVQPVPGGVELVRRVEPGHAMAIASGSPPAVIALLLDRLGIAEAFDVALSSEAVARGKPSPDVFLAAAVRLGVEPARCVVFEDSAVGAAAARAAAMPCIVRPSLADPSLASVATRVVTTWDEVTPADVRRLAGRG